MELYCIYESKCIAVNFYDPWHLEFGLLPRHQKLAEIINKQVHVIERIYQEQRLKEEQEKKASERLLEEFKNFVLNDPDFKTCTFPGARRDYAREVFTTRKDTAKYKHLFYAEDDVDYIDNQRAYYFIESIWREYRSPN